MSIFSYNLSDPEAPNSGGLQYFERQIVGLTVTQYEEKILAITTKY